MRRALIALLLLVASPSGWAQAPRIERLDLVDYGIYDSGDATTIEDSSSSGGIRKGVKMIKIKERTTIIQARTGLVFGIRVFIVGEPKDAQVRLRSVIQYPPQGLRDPKTQTTKYRDEYVGTARVGGADFRGYSFDYDWEMVPGVWTFEVWDGDRKLLEKQLTVVAP